MDYYPELDSVSYQSQPTKEELEAASKAVAAATTGVAAVGAALVLGLAYIIFKD